jgi:hypothetical protein
MRKIFVTALVAVALAAGFQPARAEVEVNILDQIKITLFGNSVYEEGIVNYVQPSWFSIIDGNQFKRFLVPPGQQVPFQMQVGNQVGVTAKPDQYGNLYMLEVVKLQDAVPLPPPTPKR